MNPNRTKAPDEASWSPFANNQQPTSISSDESRHASATDASAGAHDQTLVSENSSALASLSPFSPFAQAEIQPSIPTAAPQCYPSL